MEAAVLQRCAESGVATVPIVLHVGVEDVPDGPNSVAVMVQEKLPGLTLGEFSAQRDRAEAQATTARAGEILAAVHRVLGTSARKPPFSGRRRVRWSGAFARD